MLIEQPPRIYRMLFRKALWRLIPENKHEKVVYLTFDDGPIPETTEWILDTLARYNVVATFFCVGDNVCKYPHLYRKILEAGHHVGNHTHNHLQGLFSSTTRFLSNAKEASRWIQSPLFRPPHGHMRIPQTLEISKLYKVVMWDVVTRDYSKHITPENVFQNVKRYTRNGSIIVFHDSIKSQQNVKEALPRSIEWLISEGYELRAIPYENI